MRRPSLSPIKEQELFEEGLRHFDAADYYESHESWEEVWLTKEGDEKLFYQGLIQVAAGFHHWQKKKNKEALTCLGKGIEKLERSSFDYSGAKGKLMKKGMELKKILTL